MDTPYQSNSAEGDHHIPVSRDGLTTDANQRNACRKCNQDKRDKMPETEWNSTNDRSGGANSDGFGMDNNQREYE